jgi:hypothetical protein
LSRKD